MRLIALLILFATKPSLTDIVPKEFDHYWLVVFYRAENAPAIDARKREDLMIEHLLYLRGLTEKRDRLFGGPVEDVPGHSMEGAGVLRGDLTYEQVLELYAKEPMVRAGQMRVEIFRWMVPKESFSWPERTVW